MRLRALDLFCCAGGASMGLHRAGFDVVGVDIAPQPRYPFEFHQADALTFPLDGFDFIWASPPCQGYTSMRHAPGAIGAPKLIRQMLLRLDGVERTYRGLWTVENVEGARSEMDAPFLLCGSMFGLEAQGCSLRRHRLFDTNIPDLWRDVPKCSHDARPVIGVYGGHARKRAVRAGGRGTRDVWDGGHKAAASEALGIDWMTLGEMSEAIPPAYSEFIGRAAIAHIEAERLAACPVECWDCAGFGVVDRGYHDPGECPTCGGSGAVIRYSESGTYAKYQGGPLLGRDTKRPTSPKGVQP